MPLRGLHYLRIQSRRRDEGSILSTESIASAPSAAEVAESCAACGAPLVDDQRYCLECGERRFPISSVLLGGPPSAGATPGAEIGSPPAVPPGYGAAPTEGSGRGGAVTVIAGVGVLLLAMGVGVLIGRSGASSKSSAAPQVISVAAPTSSGASTGATAGEAGFTSDWPSGTDGYTVQLQTLPQAGTQVSAVEAAKSAASAKGAKEVGALKSEEFTSLSGSDYVIYSGVHHKKAEAEKALSGLKKGFPGAKVIRVSNGGGSSSTEGSGASSSSSGSGSGGGSGVGASESHPAPPSVLNNESKKGKSYEQESKNLPNVISTG